MKKYIGTKALLAEPMNLGDYNNYRGWDMPADEIPGTLGYLVKYEDGYESWSPKEAFDKAYRRIDNLTFGIAVEALKLGNKVARAGWNGKDMYLFLNDGKLSGIGNKARNEGIITEVLEVYPFIVMKTADNKLVPWLASQTDVLAEDWVLIK